MMQLANWCSHEEFDKLDLELVYTTGEIVLHPDVHTVIPDFARTSVDQKVQKNGMLMGLPIPMAICAFILPLTGNTVLSYQNGSGLVPNAIQYIAANGYIFSFVVAFVLYLLLMKTPLAGDRVSNGALTEEELGSITAKANMVA